MLLIEYVMHSYGIRLCAIEIKISNIQVNASLNKRNQALLYLIVNMLLYYKYIHIYYRLC